MSITAKELAKKLNLSATAVSMALNSKPGVSTETRERVLKAAQQYGYDFSRLAAKSTEKRTIYVLFYRAHNAILSYSPIFMELSDGIMQECSRLGYPMKTVQFYEKKDDLELLLEELRLADCGGLILIGTEMSAEAFRHFQSLKCPIVLLDNCFDGLDCNCVLINNRQGAYRATEYLISRRMAQPGYLKSSYPLNNFSERMEGFQRAVRDSGMSYSRSPVHTLSPTLEGAFADMMEVLEQKAPLAECYFADNDLIAIGAMKALKTKGYRIPEDIAVIGFDNISESRVVDPSLTTINIPRHCMAQVAVRRIDELIHERAPYFSKIQISTSLVKRFSA